jgi:hypothetical protein
MDIRESFEQYLADFGKALGTELVFEEDHCNFTVDGAVEIELDYYDDSDTVVAWATVGEMPEDDLAGDRALVLLALNELGSPAGGYTLSMDADTRRVIAHDNRPAEAFDSADRLAVWIDTLVELVNAIREDFAERFPCMDIDDEAEEDEP